jgi:hypothetical protein
VARAGHDVDGGVAPVHLDDVGALAALLVMGGAEAVADLDDAAAVVVARLDEPRLIVVAALEGAGDVAGTGLADGRRVAVATLARVGGVAAAGLGMECLAVAATARLGAGASRQDQGRGPGGYHQLLDFHRLSFTCSGLSGLRAGGGAFGFVVVPAHHQFGVVGGAGLEAEADVADHRFARDRIEVAALGGTGGAGVAGLADIELVGACQGRPGRHDGFELDPVASGIGTDFTLHVSGVLRGHGVRCRYRRERQRQDE